jgi:ribosome-associated toxin RatA of RatAB toxin-antitoxin module
MTSEQDRPLAPAARAQLERGEVLIETEVVPGSSLPRVCMDAMIDAPPERVWALINDTNGYTRTMPAVKRVEELSREQDGELERVRVRLTVGMPFPLKDLTSITRAVHTVRPGEFYQRAWELESGDYDANEGAWTLTPFEGDTRRTRVRYEVLAAPRIRIPGAVQKLAQKKALPKLIERLRKLCR